jgi:hypothetical protein
MISISLKPISRAYLAPFQEPPTGASSAHEELKDEVVNFPLPASYFASISQTLNSSGGPCFIGRCGPGTPGTRPEVHHNADSGTGLIHEHASFECSRPATGVPKQLAHRKGGGRISEGQTTNTTAMDAREKDSRAQTFRYEALCLAVFEVRAGCYAVSVIRCDCLKEEA